MNMDFIKILEEIQVEKGISYDTLLEALEQALISAYKKNFNTNQDVMVNIDRATGEMKVFVRKMVVDEIVDESNEILLSEAKALKPDCEVGDSIDFETMPSTFGRIAAQTARQVVVQRLREAERGMIYNQFADKEGTIISGVVGRVERRNVMIDVGSLEAILVPGEQVAGEVYKPGDRIKIFVVEVSKTSKGPQILISRTHPGLVKCLFEMEVPEISKGVIEIKAIAREAGSRTKIAVCTADANIDPIGACVGMKGSRVQNIVSELRGEKIDIIKYSDNITEFISAALNPAKVTHSSANEADKICTVIVPDNQLSLAIGKEGQNARLAAKLTGWKIDIKSESLVAEG